MKINLSKKHFALIAVFCIIVAAGFAAANQDLILKLASPTTEILPGRLVGHSSEDIVVNLDGPVVPGACAGDMSLQEALDADCIGSGGSLIFGNWESRTPGQIYGPATTDGFALAYSNGSNNPVGYTDSDSSPTVQRTGSTSGFNKALNMPVKKGDYWKVINADRIYWIPIVDGGAGGGSSLPPCASGKIIESDGAGGWVCVDQTGGAGGSLAFGDWTDVTAAAAGGAVQASALTDGIVLAHTVQADNRYIYGETPAGNIKANHRQNWYGDRVNLTMPVKKGDSWRIVGNSVEKVWWLPIVDGGAGGSGTTLPNCASGKIIESDGVGGWVCADDDTDGLAFGNWINKTSDHAVQLATTSGIVVAAGDDSTITGYTSSSLNPTEKTRSQSYPATGYWNSISMPVKEGDYWEIEFSPIGRPTQVYWIPIVDGGGGNSVFGDWTNTDSVGAVLTANSIYQAECDGIIAFTASGSGGGTFINTGNSNPPSNPLTGSDAINGPEAGNAPVKKDEYVRVAGGSPTSVRWLPYGTCNLVKQ